MTTNRSLENKVMKSMEFNRAAIQEEEEKESDELGVESDLGDDEEDEQRNNLEIRKRAEE